MQSVNNQAILGYCCNNLSEGVVGKASFSYDEPGKELTVTDESTFPAGDTLKILHVDVFDRFGGRVYGHIDAAGGNITLDVSTLNPSRGFAVAITVVSNNGVAKDGSAYKIANSQTTGGFDVEK
jgi:hypothetical protein